MKKLNCCAIQRLLQVGLALIPAFIGVLAMVNDVESFSDNVRDIVVPLLQMKGVAGFGWRALPAGLAPFAYTAIFVSEFLVGIMAIVGIVFMLRAICKPADVFEKSKKWVYFACMWGAIVWGLGFFEIAGDWFLAWMNSSPAVTGLQGGSLAYTTSLFFVFVFLKLSREED